MAAKPVKIDALEVENVKRVKAVALEPAKDGLTVIGGRNGQGKTSVLDAIAWALGGDRMRPSDPKREGAAGDPRLKVVLDNGIVVERRGKNGALKVTDPSGAKGGQKLLDSFVGQLALDLPRFLAMKDAEKADTLLQIVGVGDELAKLDREEASLYEQRKAIGQVARQKRGAAEELPGYPDAPEEEVSAAELAAQLQDVLAHNAEMRRVRDGAKTARARLEATMTARGIAQQRLDHLREQVEEAEAEVERLSMEAVTQKARAEQAGKAAEAAIDEPTEAI
ncbi:MAG: AAA family ATPase, partial [Coriobacteriaceae bacterium]|nr:AAA family ATPase [Coriobacteriaceae bacterium]